MSDTFDNGLYIDGIYYRVPILSCKRSADFLWKYADRLSLIHLDVYKRQG